MSVAVGILPAKLALAANGSGAAGGGGAGFGVKPLRRGRRSLLLLMQVPGVCCTFTAHNPPPRATTAANVTNGPLLFAHSSMAIVVARLAEIRWRSVEIQRRLRSAPEHRYPAHGAAAHTAAGDEARQVVPSPNDASAVGRANDERPGS